MDKKRFSIRIDEELFEKLRIIAGYERRSVNRQISFLIRNYIKQHEEKYNTIKDK